MYKIFFKLFFLIIVARWQCLLNLKKNDIAYTFDTSWNYVITEKYYMFIYGRKKLLTL